METRILVGGLVIDGTGREPVRGRAVVVEDGRIAAVVDDGAAAARRADRPGGRVPPARADQLPRAPLPRRRGDPTAILRAEPLASTAIKALIRARRTVEAGVTTVRDLGGREYCELSVRRAIQEGLAPGPRIIAAGRPVCMTGGHGTGSAARPTAPTTCGAPFASSCAPAST